MTGAMTSAASRAAASLLRFIMDTPGEDTVGRSERQPLVPASPSSRGRIVGMPASWALTPPYYLLFAFLCGVAGFRVGWRVGNRVALPLVESALGWVAFLLAWTMVGPIWAAASVFAWASGTSAASVYVFVGHPKETDERV